MPRHELSRIRGALQWKYTGGTFSGLQPIGMDIVEVMGCGDPAGTTGVLAAKIIREVLLPFQRVRGDNNNGP